MQKNNQTLNESPHICPHRLALFLDNRIRRLFQNPNKILGEYIRENDTVIDMGCGPGFFTIDMAKMVGPGGRVIAVDLQSKMLERVRRKAGRHGVADRIAYHQCGERYIGLKEHADFILAYYMIHETPNPVFFLNEAQALLKEGGRMLVVEPKFHVSKNEFEDFVDSAENAGLKVEIFPSQKGGRSVLFAV